jgi:TolB-like protein
MASPSCGERDLLVRSFLETGAKKDEATFYVTINPGSAKALADEYPSSFWLFVCNPQADAIVKDAPNVVKIKGVENLTDIGIALTSVIRRLDPSLRGDRRICLGLVSDVLLQHHAVQTRRWLAGLIPELQAEGFTILAVVDPRIHSSEELYAILGLFDGEISIFEKEGDKGVGKYLKINKMSNQRYLEDELPLKREEPEAKPQESTIGQAVLDKHRIAVLPFVNMSPDPNDEYLADGMTEEIISTVSGISGLRVISRTSIMRYKKTEKTVKEIGREMEVGSVLESSFRKAGNRIRVTTQLINVADDEHLWAQNYDRNLDDIFAVQSDVAKQVADALKVQLFPNEKSNIEKKATESTEAYTLYLRGRYHWNATNDYPTKEGFDKAVRYFQSAIALDPQFALGYAGLSDCYHYYGDYSFLKPAEAYPKAREYAIKAIELDPNLAEPHASLGAVLNHYYWDWKGSEKELVRAIELKPSYALAHLWYMVCLNATGRFKEAYEEAKRAAELDPLSKENRTHEICGLIYLGRVKEAVELAEKTVRKDPEYFWPHFGLGLSYFCDGRTEDAIAEQRKATTLSGNHPWQRATLAFFLGRAGKRDEAAAILKELVELSKTQSVWNTQLAEIHYSLGQRDEAFDCLERAYEEREFVIAEINYLPLDSDIRKDPRWASFQKRLGLPTGER